MVLSMTRPAKHPKTGVYWLRKRVPTDLVEAYGREHVKKTLGTKDPEVAKLRHSELLLELEAEWAALRRQQAPTPLSPNALKPEGSSGQQLITDRQAHSLAKPYGDDWLATHYENPSEQLTWWVDLYPLMWTKYPLEDEPGTRSLENIMLASMRKRCLDAAESILAENGFEQDLWSITKTGKAVGAAIQKASLLLARTASGEIDFQDDVPASSLWSASGNALSKQLAESSTRSHISLTGLVDRWWKESKAVGRKVSTYESYRNTFVYLTKFLGHDDARRVATANVIAFKDHRLSTPSPRTGKLVSAKTVKDSDLSGLKAVFEWAVQNGLLATNPAASVTIKLSKPVRLRSKGFSDDEALQILSAATNYKPGNEGANVYAAKRWIPWLAAFTGARVGELVQLRKQDVFEVGGSWVIRITPEAGTVKTNEAREVPLHPQVIELDFPNFVKQSKDGHLFLSVSDGDVRGALRTAKNRLAEFSRTIVADRNVAPNHGWRHRFKTVGMEMGIAPRILDAIQGQAPRNVAETYGDVTLKTMIAEIQKFPRYDAKKVD